MRNSAMIFASLIGLGAWACSDSSDRQGPVNPLSESPAQAGDTTQKESDSPRASEEPAAGDTLLADDTDPMVHINFLATDSMRGRNSPSTQFNTAAKYIKDRLPTYGVTGPNPGDSNGAFAQSFTQNSFAPETSSLTAEHHHDGNTFGTTLFERTFFLDDQMSPEAFEIVARKYEAARAASGKQAFAGNLRPGDPASLAAMKEAAVLAGNTHNVLGKLTGTGTKKNEIIVAMAHLDHIGVSSTGAAYNGADDNASGSSVLLSLVPLLSQAKAAGQLNRSVLFIWTAAEEDGLVGSKYFVDHPIAGIGLNEIVGVINMDMVARWDDQRISIIDTKSNGSTSYLSALLTQANNAMSDPFNRVNKDIASYARRQDGASFYDRGEDVLFVFEGLSNPAGGGNLNADYHRTTDDVAKIVAENGGNKPRRVRDLLVNTIKLAANR